MIVKEITSRDKASSKILKGIMQCVIPAKSTYGPGGRNVCFGDARFSKDGKTVAEAALEPEDSVEKIGAICAVRVASDVADRSGDSTTTALILFGAIMTNVQQYLHISQDAGELARGVMYAANEVIEYLKKQVVKISTNDIRLRQLAKISSNNEADIATHVVEAVQKVGPNGFVNIEEINARESMVEFYDGAKLDSGYKLGHFITNMNKQTCEFDNAYILICDKQLNSSHIEPIINVLRDVVLGQPLVIIADKFDDSFSQFLVINHLSSKIKVCPIEAPGYGSKKSGILQDIASITGATLFSANTGRDLNNVSKSDLGNAQKVVIGSKSTTIILSEEMKAMVKKRVNELETLILAEQTQNSSEDIIKGIKERRDNISGEVCTYRVGSLNEMERKSMHDLVEDAVLAAQSALRSGILPGGGSTLVRASQYLSKLIQTMTPKMLEEKKSAMQMQTVSGEIEQHGIDISYSFINGMIAFRDSLCEPIIAMLENASIKNEYVIYKIQEAQEDGYGWDIRKNRLCDMVANGIVDSAECIFSAIECAASYARTLISMGPVITIKKEKDKSDDII